MEMQHNMFAAMFGVVGVGVVLVIVVIVVIVAVVICAETQGRGGAVLVMAVMAVVVQRWDACAGKALPRAVGMAGLSQGCCC